MRTIASERTLKGLSQQELADEIGVSRLTVNRWESGLATPPIKRITQLCDFFGCSVDYLVGRTDSRV